MREKVTKFPVRENLAAREEVHVELSWFLVRALEERVRAANEGAAPHKRVNLSDVIEMHVAESVSLADIAHLENRMPGVRAALSKWLLEGL